MRKVLGLMLPLLLILDTEAQVTRSHSTDLCIPRMGRQDFYDIAVTGGIKTLIQQMEKHNGGKPISADKAVEVSNLFSKYILSDNSIRSALQMINLHCHVNRPEKSEKAEPVEDAFLCLWEMEAEKCYKYMDKLEGDLVIDTDVKPKARAALQLRTKTMKAQQSNRRRF